MKNQHRDIVTNEIELPITIFSKKMAMLETIVKYLHENKEISFNLIAKLMNRNNKTIWTTYHNAIKKKQTKIKEKPTKINIPLNILKNRKYAVLETIVKFLKEEYLLNFKTIGDILGRNQKTIWTTYQRTIKKNVKK